MTFSPVADTRCAAQLAARLRDQFRIELPLARVFHAPTIAGIAQTIDAIARGERPADSLGIDFALETNLDPAIVPPGAGSGEASRSNDSLPEGLLLTGATGYLGAFLLDELLRRTSEHVYCLVRADDERSARRKLADNLARYSLSTAELAERVTPVLGDLSSPRFGLSPERWEQLAGAARAIYHNGAEVNFAYPYPLLRSANVGGTLETLRLAVARRLKAVHFVSTFSVHASSEHTSDSTVTERDPLPRCESLHDGYSQSKWVAEKLLRAAAERGVPVTIYRPGRIVGHSDSGIANTKDFLHAMILGCMQLGAAPDLDLDVDMTPVDYVSRAIVALSTRPEAVGGCFHLVHPRPPRMRELVDWLQSMGASLESTPLDRWRDKLMSFVEQGGGEAAESLAAVFGALDLAADDPLARLEHPRYDASQTRALLAAAGIECPPIDERLLGVYFQRLRQSGFLSLVAADPGSGTE